MARTATAETNAPSPTHDQFEQLRQTIDRLEQQSEQGAQRGEGATAPGGPRHRSRKGQTAMNVVPQTPAQPQPGSNVPKFAQLLVDAEELGSQEAQGKDVQIKFDLKVLEAANLGAIDLTKDKHGDGIDDAVKLSEAYAKGRNKAVIFDHKEPKQRKLAATTRTMIKLGGSPKWGASEPMSTVNQLMTIRQNLRRTATKGVKLDDAHNTLMRFARDQLKLDTMLAGDDVLKGYCFRPESDPRSAEGWFRQVVKQAAALKDGKLSNCPDLDNSPEVTAIINACNKRLSAIAKAKGAAQGPNAKVA